MKTVKVKNLVIANIDTYFKINYKLASCCVYMGVTSCNKCSYDQFCKEKSFVAIPEKYLNQVLNFSL